MTLTDLQQLFGYLECGQSRFSLQNEIMFKLLVTTGLRRSEIVSLTVKVGQVLTIYDECLVICLGPI